jgi:hypothetical protein
MHERGLTPSLGDTTATYLSRGRALLTNKKRITHNKQHSRRSACPELLTPRVVVVVGLTCGDIADRGGSWFV